MAEIINGGDMLLYIQNGAEWFPIGHATSHTLNINMETRDTSNKTSGKWASFAEGRLSWDGSADGLVFYSTASDKQDNAYDLKNYIQNRTLLTFRFAHKTVSGGSSEAELVPDETQPYDQGQAYLTTYSETGADEDNFSYSVSFTGLGPLVSNPGTGGA